MLRITSQVAQPSGTRLQIGGTVSNTSRVTADMNGRIMTEIIRAAVKVPNAERRTCKQIREKGYVGKQPDQPGLDGHLEEWRTKYPQMP